MTVKTEGQHKGEYLISQGPGSISRDSAKGAATQNLQDGDLVKASGDNLVTIATAEDIALIKGIVYGNYRQAVGGRPIVVVSRLAEVDITLLRIPEGLSPSAISAKLATTGIITRGTVAEPEPPTEVPTEVPTEEPTEVPSEAPSEEPTEDPTE